MAPGRHWLPILALFLASSCDEETQKVSDPGDAGQDTAVDAGRELDVIVRELRKLNRIDSSHGPSGRSGRFYALSQQLERVAGRAEYFSMLEDPAPAVRAAGMLGVARQADARSVPTLIEAVRDSAVVDYFPGGCIGYQVTLGVFAYELLHRPDRLDRARADALLPEDELVALDLLIVADDELSARPFDSPQALARAIDERRLPLELAALRRTGTMVGLAEWQSVKAIGRLEAAREARRRFLLEVLRNPSAQPLARLAAASALTRFADDEVLLAIRENSELLRAAAGSPVALELVSTIRLRRRVDRLMRPIREASWIHQTAPLAGRAVAAFASDHPLLLDDVVSLGSFGDADARVQPARARALSRIIGRLDDFTRCWNTYANAAHEIQWLLEPRREVFSHLDPEQQRELRAALTAHFVRRASACP